MGLNHLNDDRNEDTIGYRKSGILNLAEAQSGTKIIG
jgi:hypothetical protein